MRITENKKKNDKEISKKDIKKSTNKEASSSKNKAGTTKRETSKTSTAKTSKEKTGTIKINEDKVTATVTQSKTNKKKGMGVKKRRRLIFLVSILTLVFSAVGISLYASTMSTEVVDVTDKNTKFDISTTEMTTGDVKVKAKKKQKRLNLYYYIESMNKGVSEDEEYVDDEEYENANTNSNNKSNNANANNKTNTNNKTNNTNTNSKSNTNSNNTNINSNTSDREINETDIETEADVNKEITNEQYILYNNNEEISVPENSIIYFKYEYNGAYSKNAYQLEITNINSGAEETEDVSDEELEAAAIKNIDYKTKYFIRVNIEANTVTVYGKDKNGKYGKAVKAMVCSTGKATPKKGIYKTTDKYKWRGLVGDVWGQYATRIVGSILFHSVPYLTSDPGTLKYQEYDKLGTKASAGCIRLMVVDALWIYNNCEKGTQVEFYSDPNPGPLGKPESEKISDNKKFRGWDPTDPNPLNPWKTGVVPPIYWPKKVENVVNNTIVDTNTNTNTNINTNTNVNTICTNHIWDTVEATCIATGKRICKVCNKTETLELKTHTWNTTEEATCTTAGKRICTVCNKTETLELKTHTWNTTEEATCTTVGKRTCTVCNKEETIDFKKHNFSGGKCIECPATETGTGDSGNTGTNL